MLTAYVKKKATEHAMQCYPRESCGLIISVNAKPKYYPCRNVAAHQDDFKLHPMDYAKAEEKWQVLAVVHSHPDASPLPSEADKVSCEATKLPWHIVSVNSDGSAHWFSFEPQGYYAPLVGRNFHHGVLDCYTIVRDFYSRELGIELQDFERDEYWWEQKDGPNLYLDNYEAAGWYEVSEPQYGDMVLMSLRSEKVNHAGVYLGDTPLKSQPELFTMQGMMLHHPMPRLSDRVVYNGYWKDITRLIVRHKDYAGR